MDRQSILRSYWLKCYTAACAFAVVMECLGATPLERLCEYIINLFPVPLLYSAGLAVAPSSPHLSLSFPLLYSIPTCVLSSVYVTQLLPPRKQFAGARGREEEKIRSIFFSGNRPPLSDSLPHSCCLCSSFYNRLVWPHLWSIVDNLMSLISSHTQHVMEHVTMSTCSSYTMGGGGDGGMVEIQPKHELWLRWTLKNTWSIENIECFCIIVILWLLVCLLKTSA